MRLDREGRIEVLLVTSRETRRWVIPKGWPVVGLEDWEAAAREAEEEAGVVGDIDPVPLGSFTYFKRVDDHFQLLDVMVYPLWVRSHAAAWKEMGQREQAWLSPSQAAELVQEPGLKAMLRTAPASAGEEPPCQAMLKSRRPSGANFR